MKNFPFNWAVKVTDESSQVVGAWLDKNCVHPDGFSYKSYLEIPGLARYFVYPKPNGNYANVDASPTADYITLSLENFRHYIL